MKFSMSAHASHSTAYGPRSSSVRASSIRALENLVVLKLHAPAVDHLKQFVQVGLTGNSGDHELYLAENKLRQSSEISGSIAHACRHGPLREQRLHQIKRSAYPLGHLLIGVQDRQQPTFSKIGSLRGESRSGGAARWLCPT